MLGDSGGFPSAGTAFADKGFGVLEYIGIEAVRDIFAFVLNGWNCADIFGIGS